MTETFELLADTLGVSNSVITAILIVVVAIVLSTAILMFSGSLTLSLLASGGVILLGAFLGYIPLWVAMLTGLVGAVALGFGGDIGGSIVIKKERNPKELILRIEKSSSKWSQYINNFDSLLGIKTVVVYSQVDWGLFLNSDRTLQINDSYDWYITDKHPEQDIFKVVGLHKEDSLENLVYLLGKNPGTGEPFLTSISSVYLEGDLEECLIWSKRKELSPNVGGFIGTSAPTLVNIVPVVFVASILLGAVSWLGRQ